MSVIFLCPVQIKNLKSWGVSHLSMSRPNPKFEIFSEVEGGGLTEQKSKNVGNELTLFWWGGGQQKSKSAGDGLTIFWWGVNKTEVQKC